MSILFDADNGKICRKDVRKKMLNRLLYICRLKSGILSAFFKKFRILSPLDFLSIMC